MQQQASSSVEEVVAIFSDSLTSAGILLLGNMTTRNDSAN